MFNITEQAIVKMQEVVINWRKRNLDDDKKEVFIAVRSKLSLVIRSQNHWM